MSRALRLGLVGCLVLVALAGCGRYFFGQREAWRKEAETACLKSGAVRESASLLRAEPINGPGMCGADFPFKVMALGETQQALGYTGSLRPPGAIPNGGANGGASAEPSWPVTLPRSNDPSRNVLSGQPPRPLPAPVSSAPLSAPVSNAPASLAPPRATSPYPPAQSVPLSRNGQSAQQLASSFQPVEIKPAATLACPIVSALDRWVADAVQPAAQRWFNQPVVEMRQISAYSCRGMNGQSHTRISEHAFGNAIDISSFVLADGARITVKDGWRGSPEEQGFLRDVQGAACEYFTTVLAPGSNRFHYDHIHLDLMQRASGRVICNPDAVSGEEVAARAAKERGYAKAGGSRLSHSLQPETDRSAGAAQKVFQSSLAEDDDWVEDDGPRRPDR